MQAHKARVEKPQDCAKCGRPVVREGDEISEIAKDRWDDMPVGRAFEVVINGRLRPVVRCAHCKRRNLIKWARVTKVVPYPHKCPCGCNGRVDAVRVVEVVRYR